MLLRRNIRPNPDQIEAIIGPRATFSGQLRCDGSIRLDGTVEGGTIETPANVLITEGARVKADIKAKAVSIVGAYDGVIVADRVELLEGGRLWGTIHVRTFLLDEGGNGVVISSLHSREVTRVYAKPLVAWQTNYPLTDEEQQAIARARGASLNP